MTLSEGRLSHLAQSILKAVVGGKLGTVRNEHRFLVEVKKILLEAFDSDGRLDQAVRARMPKRVLPGSREWDVLYQKYLDEERRKLSGR
ncbi:MAG: DUF507 family protein [bacterium]|nr:DUF507 family protein [bacterium]